MRILAIDTATEACSVALKHDEEVFTRFDVCPQEHSKRLLPMVDKVLDEAALGIQNVDYLAVSTGPGSFTGVRIAMGMAQGLAFGANLPVIGVSTLQTMAQETYAKTGSATVLCAIDARMSEVYFCMFKADLNGVMQQQADPEVLPPEQVVEKYIGYEPEFGYAGTGWQAYEPLTEKIPGEPLVLYPNAEFMLPWVEQEVAKQRWQSIMDLEPVYVRDKVTWKKLPGR